MEEQRERQLVTIETVVDVRPIVDADAIEAVVVRGWTVVAKKSQFHSGERCVYIEIDAALPLRDERFAFLEPRGAKTLLDGTRAHVLKTARLRGTYSQGLVLPLALFPELAAADEGADLAAMLSVTKWEPPLPAAMGGDMIGAFPTALARKTDAERAQNLVDVWDALVEAGPWIATEKLDGTSVTVLNDDGHLRVCGRNWELADGENVYWKAAKALDCETNLLPGEVVQAEVYGEGVQGNPLRVRGRRTGVFGFFRGRTSVPREEWPDWAAGHAVPVYVDLTLPTSVEDAVVQIDGIKSLVNPDRLAEGIVWSRVSGGTMPELDGRSSFKVISNKYLLKQV